MEDKLNINKILLEYFELEHNYTISYNTNSITFKCIYDSQEILESNISDKEKVEKCKEILNKTLYDTDKISYEIEMQKEDSLNKYRDKYMHAAGSN